jgi:hypothetical protein
MQSARSAEWILRRVTAKERAASIIGDLVEIERQKGQLWFWLSVAGIVVSLAWRRPLAFLASFYVAGWTLYGFEMALRGINTQHRIPIGRPWAILFGLLEFAGSTLCAMALFSVVRYGIQEHITQAAFVWAAIFTLAIYFWWNPLVITICAALASGVAFLSIRKSKRRIESLVIFVTVAVGCGIRLTGFFLCGIWQHIESHGQLWGSQQMGEHIFFKYGTFGLIVLSFWVTTLLWVRVYERITLSQKTRIAE